MRARSAPTRRIAAPDPTPTDLAACVLDHVPSLVLVADERGDIVYASPSIERLLGFAPAEVMGRGWWRLSRADRAAAAAERDRLAASARNPHLIESGLYERTLVDRDGRTRWFMWREDSGPGRTVIGVGHDITERKQAELERRALVADLGERVKEATMLHAAARLLHDTSRSLPDLLRELVNALPAAMRYCDAAAARVRLGTLDVATGGYVESAWRHRASLGAEDFVEVAYVRPCPWEGADPFLAEERAVLTSVAEMLASHADRRAAEARLAQSEARYRELIERMPVVAYRAAIAAGSPTQYVSPQIESLIGVRPELLLDPPTAWVERIHADDRDMVLRQLAAVHANGGLLDLEYRMLHQDGQVVWVHDQAAVIRGADGSAECLHGVMLDITARKRAEEAGRASAHALQMLIDASPVAIIEAGVDGRVRLWNPAAERLFGWTAAEVLGRPNPIVPADRAGEFRSAFDRARAGDPWQFETERQRKDGTRLEVLVAVAPIRDAAGALTSIVGLISDVTDQRRAERLLRQREEHFRSLIENAHDIIAVVDPDGILTYISPSVASVMGYAPEAVVGTRCLDWIHADDLPLARERLAGVTSSPDDHRRLTVRARHADGQWRSLEVMARATVDEARLGPVIVNARDVTERLSLEQQLLQAQKMEAIGQLAAGIAHDFNNLLTAILGYGELLRARIDPASGLLTDLDEVLNAGQRAGALTRQLLAIGRQQVLQPQPVDLNTVVTDIGRMLTRVIGEDVTLQTTLSSALGIVNADPGQMQQVLLNLAVNARDAMPGGGTLTIATANVAITEPWTDQNARLEPGRWVCLTVADSGTGMPPEVAAHVFEPFFTTKPPGRGTGLGLSTVYGIVTQSQGRIAISSTPGEGTVVRIYLPEANPGVLPAERTEPGEPECAGGRETILLVEDDGNIRRLARRALELREYRVIEADSPLAAIECSEDHDQAIDLLVSDVVMPGVNGFDLARTLQAARPGLKAMYISGFAREMHDGRMPPDAIFLQKPFTAESLAQSVRQCLDRAAPAGR